MIRILHIVGSVEKAGIETFLINLYRNIDRDRIQFDFAIYTPPSEDSYENEIISLGGHIFVIPDKKKGWVSNYKAIKELVEDNGYNVVWRSCSNCVGGSDLIPAKAGGARIRILHAHSSNSFGVEKVLHNLLRPFVCLYATNMFSCGKRAGKWMFGNRKNELIPNGIDTHRFRYDEQIRSGVRKELSISNATIVIGCVARFEKVKNHAFLVDLFSEYHKKYSDSILIFIGDGELEQTCKDKVFNQGIVDSVLFLGKRNDVEKLMQAMDVFLLTSIYEGFPVTLVEAQAAGLPCVVSDSVSKETDIYGGVSFVGLSEPYEKWIETIYRLSGKRYKDGYKSVADKGFDIGGIVKKISKMMQGLEADKGSDL